jgi:hypothetical protein
MKKLRYYRLIRRGWPLPKIAKALGLPLSTVETWAHDDARAMTQLQDREAALLKHDPARQLAYMEKICDDIDRELKRRGFHKSNGRWLPKPPDPNDHLNN